MKAAYDSEADALSIDLIEVDRWDDSEDVEETYCHVAISKGRPANVELLNPAEQLDLLSLAARSFGLDAEALLAAAKAALAAPDRAVTLDVGGKLAA